MSNVFGNRSESSTSNEVKSVLSDNKLHEFTSPESKFSILMPGFPKIEKSSETVDNQEVNLTSYTRVIDNHLKLYKVEALDFGSSKQLPGLEKN